MSAAQRVFDLLEDVRLEANDGNAAVWSATCPSRTDPAERLRITGINDDHGGASWSLSCARCTGAEIGAALALAASRHAAPEDAAPLPPRAPNAEDAPGSTIDTQDGTEAVPPAAHALVSVREACVSVRRDCLSCGSAFVVNFRHSETHRFCSAACRSRERHRENKRARDQARPRSTKAAWLANADPTHGHVDTMPATAPEARQ